MIKLTLVCCAVFGFIMIEIFCVQIQTTVSVILSGIRDGSNNSSDSFHSNLFEGQARLFYLPY